MNYTNSIFMPIYNPYTHSIVDELEIINRELFARRKKQIEYEREHTQDDNKRFKLILELDKAKGDFARIMFDIDRVKREAELNMQQQQANLNLNMGVSFGK